ncbi:MAG: FMN-binding domain-containing protein [Bacteroidetes bacterium GWE2_39_28]|nr:MAG: FMN-binding domain-containing protein [Bacteroidetes bacterium GWE2_39_28]OFY12458.1 MAG: FMN-binding domain-containing protein [Bacteroidetes bacterium GWF2_39_10]OFZ08793.1 MAG: FMN-binding domain-containing protein [Bacteroidetes bacterium RIFOXYB2_FULL_39_7]OFZ10682.1 MAG: FMN-binding domain-containing protein [Bacteroidetes bacterium RIFOXYC2_FULL_39_11]HCT93403.1 FMN-binding domain-containing protein [Rikenellaceae bacterium]
MAKSSTLKNMVMTLSAVTLIASALLGGVYALTKGPIDIAMAAKTNNAIASVSPEFDNDPSAEMFMVESAGKSYKVYPAKMGENAAGYAIETYASGFGGRIALMVGFNVDGTIKGISVLSHTETPGLGDKIEPSKSSFSAQFEGKDPQNFKLVVKKDGGDVDAITASTITSRAYCDAVTLAWEAFKLCSNQKSEEEKANE